MPFSCGIGLKAQVSVIFRSSDDLGDVDKMINALLSYVVRIHVFYCRIINMQVENGNWQDPCL